MWIREEHGGTRNLSQSGSNEQGENQKFKGIFQPKLGIQAVFPAKNWWSTQKIKVFTNIARVFLAEIGDSSGFPAENRWSPKKKKKKDLHAKNVMKSGVSPQKLR